MSIELRPPSREDAAAIAEATNAFSRLGGFEDSVEEVEEWFDAPSLDLGRDARLAMRDGSIVGYGEVSDSSGEGRFLWADVRVDPAHQEAATVLLDFVEEHAGDLAAPGGLIKVWSPESAGAWRELLESRGYQLHHYSLRMMVDLDAEPAAPDWPEGISVRTFDSAKDERAVYEVQQETFSDQRDFSPAPFEDWRHWAMRKPFDPSLWFVAEDGDDIAGICLCRSEWGGDAELGWVSTLGVRRPWRRRGLGGALLAHSFRELQARGKKRAGLGVDAENPTGAVQLYERAGMSVQRRLLWYEKAAR